MTQWALLRELGNSLQRRGYARSTMTRRMSIARAYLEHLEQRGVTFSAAALRDVDEWLDSRPCNVRNRYQLICHLHMVYRWAQRYGYADSDPTELVERPRLPRSLPRPARAAGVDEAIRAGTKRMAAMISLMADAGLRCCEVSRLDWRDVDLGAGVLVVRHGKGGRDRMVGIPPRLMICLAALDETQGPVATRGNPQMVSRNVGKFLRRMGVDATAHQLRHLYGTRLYEATAGDLLAVQNAMGHASVATTQIYAAIDARRAIEVAQRLAA